MGDSEQEYIQRVRRYRPSDLVPVVAAIAAERSSADFTPQTPESILNPWTLADIARVSLTKGNEHRAASKVTEQDVRECGRLYYEFDGSGMQAGGMQAVTKFLWRVTTAEQLPYQNLGYNHVGRSAALLMQTRSQKSLKVLTPGWDTKLFGCSLAEYVGVGQMLYMSACLREGVYDSAWLAQPGGDELSARIDPQIILKTIERHYAVQASELKALDTGSKHPNELRRYTHNPLVSKPVIHDLGPHLIVPVPQAILRKLGVLGIYYIGVNNELGFGTPSPMTSGTSSSST